MLSVILVLMIAAQPVQAGFCDMEPSDGTPRYAHTEHAGMQHAGMQHAGMQDDGGQGAASHDCCTADPESTPSCDPLDQCGSCTTGLAAVPALNGPNAMPPYSHRVLLTPGQVAPSHASPPYRPPTSIS
jgi:hypothetical protein